jgi:hypothetical protein
MKASRRVCEGRQRAKEDSGSLHSFCWASLLYLTTGGPQVLLIHFTGRTVLLLFLSITCQSTSQAQVTVLGCLRRPPSRTQSKEGEQSGTHPKNSKRLKKLLHSQISAASSHTTRREHPVHAQQPHRDENRFRGASQYQDLGARQVLQGLVRRQEAQALSHGHRRRRHGRRGGGAAPLVALVLITGGVGSFTCSGWDSDSPAQRLRPVNIVRGRRHRRGDRSTSLLPHRQGRKGLHRRTPGLIGSMILRCLLTLGFTDVYLPRVARKDYQCIQGGERVQKGSSDPSLFSAPISNDS